MRWMLLAAVLFSGCKGKSKRPDPGPVPVSGADAGISAGGAGSPVEVVPGKPGELAGTTHQLGGAIGCSAIFDAASVRGLMDGATVTVRAAALVSGRAPECEVVVAGIGTPVMLMVDCSVRGGQATKAMATLAAEETYLALAELGSEALTTPGQIVFVDADTECLVTVTSLDLAADTLLALARLAERGVAPSTVW